MIQGGCPQGTGTGGPGYTFEDEINDHKVVRGALAMANAGPDTNGSQFFVVYGDSALRPNYTVFGTVGAEGLKTLDKVAAGGIQPTAEDPAPVDGTPALRTELLRVRPGCWF